MVVCAGGGEMTKMIGRSAPGCFAFENKLAGLRVEIHHRDLWGRQMGGSFGDRRRGRKKTCAISTGNKNHTSTWNLSSVLSSGMNLTHGPCGILATDCGIGGFRKPSCRPCGTSCANPRGEGSPQLQLGGGAEGLKKDQMGAKRSQRSKGEWAGERRERRMPTAFYGNASIVTVKPFRLVAEKIAEIACLGRKRHGLGKFYE